MMLYALLDIGITLLEALTPSGDCCDQSLRSISKISRPIFISKQRGVKSASDAAMCHVVLFGLSNSEPATAAASDGLCTPDNGYLQFLTREYYNLPHEAQHRLRLRRNDIPLWRFALY